MDLSLLLILVVESLGVWVSPTLCLSIGMTVDMDAIRIGEVGIAVAYLHSTIRRGNLIQLHITMICRVLRCQEISIL